MSTYVAVFALVLGYVALVAAYCALRTLAKLRRASALLARGARGPQGQESLLEAIHRHAELTAVVAEQLDGLHARMDAVSTEASSERAGDTGALRNVALVRYDAFGEMSGRMSFSLALLDDHATGVTISAITGPTDTRVYAKGVAAGKGEHDLSPEEQQAVSSAVLRPRSLLGRKAG